MKGAELRTSRLKVRDRDGWYHCYNRAVGLAGERPFGRVEKAKFVRLLMRVSRLYAIEAVAYQVLGNHYHLLLYAPAVQPSEQEVCRRYAAFHGGRRTLCPGSALCREWQKRMVDISWFMRHLQQLFSMWYNNTRSQRRRGSVWADRFKNTLLEDGPAVWHCWKYIENNPVRAGLVTSAARYRFGSHGVWFQKGRHPFEDNLRRRMLPLLAGMLGVKHVDEACWKLDEVLAGRPDSREAATGFSLSVHRRMRYWTDGLIIGSESFLRDVSCRLNLPRRRRPPPPSDVCRNERLLAWRRIRPIS